MRRFFRLLPVLAFAGATAVAAQESGAAQGPAAGAPAAQCEFHVWPGEGLTSIFYGLFHGSTVNAGQQGRRGYPRVPPDSMTTAAQVALLEAAAPQRQMRHPDYLLIVHDAALDSRIIRTSVSRIAQSQSPCYAELIVDDVVLQQDWLNGAKLRILFRYRDFGPAWLAQRSLTTWADADLDHFPPRADADIPAAQAELRAAYGSAITVFAGMLARPQRRPR
jgi:hypothetical protein